MNNIGVVDRDLISSICPGYVADGHAHGLVNEQEAGLTTCAEDIRICVAMEKSTMNFTRAAELLGVDPANKTAEARFKKLLASSFAIPDHVCARWLSDAIYQTLNSGGNNKW